VEHRDDVVDARMLNISREGVFLAMDPPRPIGTRVRLTLQIEASNEKYTLEGVVVRCVPDGDEPPNPGEQPGVAVFLTITSPGYLRFCDELAARAAAD
jgi:hypothetical protein